MDEQISEGAQSRAKTSQELTPPTPRTPRRSHRRDFMQDVQRGLLEEAGGVLATQSGAYRKGFQGALQDRAAYARPQALMERLQALRSEIFRTRRMLAVYHAAEGVPPTLQARLDRLGGEFHACYLVARTMSMYLGFQKEWLDFSTAERGSIPPALPFYEE